MAKDTLRVTTHKGIRHAVHPLHCRYSVDNVQLNRKCLNVQFYTDHLLVKTKSLEGNMGARIYTTEKFTVAYLCINNSELGYTLRWFADDFQIPDRLSSDLALEITVKHREFHDQIKRLRVELTHSEVERSSHNHAAEGEIGHLKNCFGKNMVSNKVPKRLWCMA